MKKLLILILAVLLSTAAAACSFQPPAASSAVQTTGAELSDPDASPSNGKIGIVMPTKSLERWNRDGAFLRKQFESQGYAVSLVYSGNNVTQQIRDIEAMIADMVDLLVIVAIDGDSLSDVLQSAVDADIPVIAYDRLIMNTDVVSYYVSFDNYTVGKLMGQYVVDTLGLKLDDTSTSYNMEFTGGDAADNNALFVFNGAYDVLKPYLDAGILKVPSGQTDFESVATARWNTATANNRMQNILSAFYSDGTRLDVALCSNDSTALGVLQALESDYAEKNAVLITGQDGDEANLAEIINGKQSMTVYKAFANEAVVTVDLALAILRGETPDAALVKTAGWQFDCLYDTESYDNNNGIVPSYLLVPAVVTKENFRKVLVEPGYYTMGTDGYPKAVE
jgi:putative multiple sugar transport system substrate-binding protein